MMADTRPLILLVDDVPTNLHVLAAALKAEYRIKVATNGTAGLELAARADKPQLILLDVMMPGISGIEVLRRLRAAPNTRDIPVIFVSADTSEQSQLDGLDLGADDYLTKPVVTTVLLARVRNLIQRKEAEAQLRLAAHVFEHSGEAIMITDRDNHIVDINPAFINLTGYALEDVRGQNPRILSAGRADAETYQTMWQALREKGFWQGELWDRHKDGATYPKLLTISVVKNSFGEIDYYIASFTDITERKAAEERIRHVAHHDALTGLPNRLHLLIVLEQTLAAARRDNEQVALMFIDMDRFKTINDTLGHHVGDDLLVEVAHRLRDCVRESDLVARLGGDEFVVVISGNAAAANCAQVAEKILIRLGQPYDLAGHVLHSSPSIGIAVCPDDGGDIDTLMKHADTAMYHAKAAGRNNFQYFSAEMNRASGDRLRLENGLRRALADDQFILHYQIQVDPQSGAATGVEALVRWQHPEHGIIMPDRFIALAEETGIILPLGEWVLDAACRQLRRWHDAGQSKLRMAVNLSLHQMRKPDLVARVAATLERHGLAAEALELEITESAAMQNVDATIRVLTQLRDLGVQLAIDDFGTGHSSLSRLKLLPVHRLKLDRSFVMDIEHDPDDATICAATIALAHALGLEVVAEGVETAPQRDYLRQLGCDTMQGYLFARPLPAAALFT